MPSLIRGVNLQLCARMFVQMFVHLQGVVRERTGWCDEWRRLAPPDRDPCRDRVAACTRRNGLDLPGGPAAGEGVATCSPFWS
jgi:hypothetical protein